MISKELVMKVIDAVVVIALIVAGVFVLFGFDGVGMDVLMAFVAFGVATLLVDSKKGTTKFVVGVAKDAKAGAEAAVEEAKVAVDKMANDVAEDSKKKLKGVIDYAQKALEDLEKKVQ